MDRSIQSGLMILGCVALIVAAIALPALILRPAHEYPVSQIQPIEQIPAPRIPAARTSAAKPPVARAPVVKIPAPEPRVAEAPVVEEESGGDGLSRGQRFQLVQQKTIGQLGLGDLSSSLAKAFSFPVARNDAVFGIDVSHHNTDNCRCQIDWNLAAAQNVAFVYAKATEGVRFRDPSFDGHWRALAQQPKILRGAYHFLAADIDPEAQAKYFLQKMGTLQSRDLPPVLDLEWDIYPGGRKWTPQVKDDYWGNLGPDEILDRALKWLQFVEKETGRIPIVYTSRAWWMERIKDEKKLDLLKHYPIWISAMEDDDLRVEKPGTKGGWSRTWDWKLWQFTNRGDLSKAGIKNPPTASTERVDVNIFAGSLEGFQQAMGIAAAIEVVKRDTPDASNAKSGGASPSGAGSGSGNVALNDTPKDTQKENQTPVGPGTDNNSAKPSESNAAQNPAVEGGGTIPAESQKEPPKDSQASNNPAADSNASNPADSGTTANSATSGDAPKPDQAQNEPQKEAQAGSTAGSDNGGAKPNDTSAVVIPPAGGGTTAADAPQKDPQKDAQAGGTPGPDNVTAKPSESTSAETPVIGGGTVLPDSAQKEPQKDAQSASMPAPDNGASNPSASSPAVSPVTSDTAAAQKEPQKEGQAGSTPASDGGDAKPNDSSIAANPPTGSDASPSDASQKEPPKETQAASAPPAESNADRPGGTSATPDQATGGAVTAAEPPKEPPKETQVTNIPASDSGAGKPNESNAPASPVTGGGVVTAVEPPKELPKEPQKETQVASVPTPDSSTAGTPGTGTGVTVLPPAPPSEKPTIEIVLKNGRTIRADPSIDSTVLMRLIDLLEKD